MVGFGFLERDRASQSTATLRQQRLRSLNACRDLEKIVGRKKTSYSSSAKEFLARRQEDSAGRFPALQN